MLVFLVGLTVLLISVLMCGCICGWPVCNDEGDC